MAQGSVQTRAIYRAVYRDGRREVGESFPTRKKAEEWLREQGRRGTVRAGQPSYRARFRDPQGVQQSKTFAKKGDADRWLNGQLASAASGDFIDPRAGRVTLRDYGEAWAKMQPHRPSTARATKTRLATVTAALGDRPLGKLRQSEVQAFVAGLAKTHAASTVEATYRLLSSVMKAAVDDRVIARTPCKNVSLPRSDAGEVVPMTAVEMQRLLASMTARLQPSVVVVAGSGLRQGELFGLTVDRVDWLRRTIRVDRQLVGMVDGAPVFGPPKTPASNRTIPVPEELLEVLTEHLRERGEGPERLLFTNAAGRPVTRARASDAWRLAVGKAGLSARGWHDLRHFYASLLIQQNLSVKVVQKRLGHRSAVETLDTYGHLWPDSEDDTRNAVAGVLGPLLADPAPPSCDHSVTKTAP